jgi:hypothetical protein
LFEQFVIENGNPEVSPYARTRWSLAALLAA